MSTPPPSSSPRGSAPSRPPPAPRGAPGAPPPPPPRQPPRAPPPPPPPTAPPPVMRQPLLRVVQHTAERPVRVEVDARHRHLLNPQPQPRRLHPQLQRHPPSRLRDAQPGQRLPPIRLEPTEGVGQVQPKLFVQLLGDDPVDLPPVLRRRRVLPEVAQVPTPP